MTKTSYTKDFSLTSIDNQQLANLCGNHDEHLRQIEDSLGVEISNRGNVFQITGSNKAIENAKKALLTLYQKISLGDELSSQAVNGVLQETSINYRSEKEELRTHLTLKSGLIKPRGYNQKKYISQILNHDINFGIGPAGTGKTYLAVACAISALEEDLVQRIILVRPAVEAGERLGFLPGDLTQKIDPYLRPLYDALYEMLGFERVAKLIERNIIEVAPLAYMRGRTLNDAFIILDEGQNATKEQMKMLLTRIGFNSKAVITGDLTQIDLPKNTSPGLQHVINILKNIRGIKFTYFESKDVVRHPLVQAIVNAYHKYEKPASGTS